MQEPVGPSESHSQDLDRLRSLELELAKTRSEAKVARLEARAVELELMIRRVLERAAAGPPETPPSDADSSETVQPDSQRQDSDRQGTTPGDPNSILSVHDAQSGAPKPTSRTESHSGGSLLTEQALTAAIRTLASVDSGTHDPVSSEAVASPAADDDVVAAFPTDTSAQFSSQHAPGERLPTARFASWDAVRDLSKTNRIDRPGIGPVIEKQVADEEEAKNDAMSFQRHCEPSFKAKSEPSKSPSSTPSKLPLPVKPKKDTKDPPARLRRDLPHAVKRPRMSDLVVDPIVPAPSLALVGLPNEHQPAISAESAELSVSSDESDEEPRKRSRPAAWLASLITHIVILLLAAAFTLSNPAPKDQVSLTASATEPSEPVMETFAIETEEVQPEVSEPTPSETQYEISEMGEMAITEFKPSEIAGPPAPPIESMLSSSSAASAAAMSLKSNSEATMQFCGVDGGGNHFVYLVDSSGSMGSAFESARAELLDSISQLKPDQRFYVIFFDAEPDYMRLSDPSADETRSLKASVENKQALKRWAMTIKMDRGKAPYDPIRFALDLQPDVIFLLSDGEFPQGIEDLLKEINRQDNLFGDDGPISIVHTIGYHSREGESRMKRIAKQNGGQYRHIAKP